jgi:hypothetical protein
VLSRQGDDGPELRRETSREAAPVGLRPLEQAPQQTGRLICVTRLCQVRFCGSITWATRLRLRSQPAVIPSRTETVGKRVKGLAMSYVCIEMIDRNTGTHHWFCKNIPGWRLPCGAVLRAVWCSFVARRRFPFERYDIIPHITKRPVQ